MDCNSQPYPPLYEELGFPVQHAQHGTHSTGKAHEGAYCRHQAPGGLPAGRGRGSRISAIRHQPHGAAHASVAAQVQNRSGCRRTSRARGLDVASFAQGGASAIRARPILTLTLRLHHEFRLFKRAGRGGTAAKRPRRGGGEGTIETERV